VSHRLRDTTGLAGLVLILLLCGCATPGGRPDAERALSVLQADVEYTDDDNQPIDARFQPGQLVLLFPYVPGQIFGSPGSTLLFTKRLSTQDSLHLDLTRALPGLRQGASTLQASADTEGLAIRPARTRLARIGTFPFDARAREPLGEGGFIDARTREHLILMYFDRPCVLSGTLHIGEKSYRHDITIPVAGFHLLRVQQQDARHYTLVRADATSAITFSIHLLNLQQT
jgi:hypothetical protein